MFFTGTHRGQRGLTGSACNVPNIAHFPQKSMIYARSGRLWGRSRNITKIRVKAVISISSVAGAGIGGKLFFEFAFHALEILSVARRVRLLWNVRPALGLFGIDIEPYFQSLPAV